MLKSLEINNYAIINQLEIDFNRGLNIVTGETGAGKSIILGALSLLLGQRADTSVLKNKDRKCIVEGTFDISRYQLESFFKENDIDFEEQTIIRREIAVNGKSRAFVNDVPVNLNVLKELGIKLIDIHSQHENLNLSNNEFQLKVVDTLADNSILLAEYKIILRLYNDLKTKLSKVKEETEKLKSDREYFEFQFNELEKANLKQDELDELESEYHTLTHAEEIKELLTDSINLLNNNEINVLANLKSLIQHFQKLKELISDSGSYFERIESVYIELKDLAAEIEKLDEKTNFDPERIETVNNRLNLIYSLLQKHHVKTINELIKIRDEYKEKLENIFFSDEKISALENEIHETYQKLEILGNELSESRKNVIPSIEQEVNRLLSDLGMPTSAFKIKMEKKEGFTYYGADDLMFLYSPGKDIEFQNLAKTASGGEISRLMLSIKSLITQFINLPTIIFDEIDSGISGEIADRMGNIVKRISKDMQVINITHLPQVASKGDCHYLVHKTDNNNITETHMKLLSNEERITEVAKMLSGSELTDAAIQNAKELLKS